MTYFSAAFISDFYKNDQLFPLIQVMSFSFLIGAMSSVQSTRLRKELNYTLLTKVGVVSSLTSGAIAITLAFFDAGVWSLVVQILSMGVIYNIYIWSVTKWYPGMKFSWKALTQLWGFGFRMFISTVINSMFERLDFLIIGKLFTPTTLGYFQRAKSLNSLVIEYSSGSLMAVLFPVLSKVQNDLPRFQNIILKSLGIISFIVFLLLGGLYIISEELIVLLFSEKWFPSVELFKILVLSGFGYPISALLVNVLSSRGNSKAFLRLEIYKKSLLSLNFVVLYLWGLEVYLYGLIATTLLGVVLNISFAAHEIKLPFFLFVKPIVTQIGITVFAVIVTLFITRNLEQLNIIMLIIKGSVFTLLYGLLNYFIKTSSYVHFIEQIMSIRNKKLRK